jgi:LysR family carnitine catabolism transcriptional activator
MNLKLRQLQGFAAAATHGSFSAAARELTMTQPAFSQLVRELESSLRVKLFERTTRRIELTDAGRRFLAMIRRPLDDLDDAYRIAREMAAGTRGRIAFSSLPSVAFGLVTMALARFKALHPGITVRLIEDQDFNIAEKVLHREVDFGIGTLKTPHEELAFRELLPDELQAVYPARHPLAAKRRITWRDLAAGPLVLLPRQSSVRALVEQGCAAAGVAREPDYEVANMVTALSMVRAGLGVTVMPHMVLAELNMKGLAAGCIHDPRPVRSIGIVTRRDRPLSPAAAAYVELLFATARGAAYNKLRRSAGSAA